MKVKNLILLVILLSAAILAQDFPPGPPRGGRNFNRIDALEKAKIIEILNLDEETSIKLFARRNAVQNKIRELSGQRESILDNIEALLKDSEPVEWEEMEKLFSTEKMVLNERLEFYKNLQDILSKEQIAKLMVVESRFRRELRDIMMQNRRKPQGKRGYQR